MSSDHFSPWSERQGESGFAWSLLGAALARPSLPFGVVNAPGQRYHPAIIAQAAATLCEMFPERLWIALGTGEASNEHITGERWPRKAMRTARLRECVDVMRALFAGEEVAHDGLVTRRPRAAVDAARGAAAAARRGGERGDRALGRRMGRRAGRRSTSRASTLRRMLDAFREGGGEGKPVALQVHLSLGAGRGGGAADRARPVAHQRLRPAALLGPRDARAVRRGGAATCAPEDVREAVLVSVRSRRSTSSGSRSSPRSASTTIYAAPRRPGPATRSSTRSASTSCRSWRHDDARPPATCGGRTRSSTASTSRRSSTPTATAAATSPGLDRARRLPRRARRHLPVADAVLPVAQPRRRLRHHRLLRRRPAPRARSATSPSWCAPPRPRHARDRRPRREPHVRPAPVVPGRRARAATRRTATSTSGATRSPRRSRATSSSPTRRDSNWAYDRRPGSTTCTASTRTSPT